MKHSREKTEGQTRLAGQRVGAVTVMLLVSVGAEMQGRQLSVIPVVLRPNNKTDRQADGASSNHTDHIS